MKKRGQITVFVILGIVIVALVVLFLAFKKELVAPAATPENLNSVMKDIKEHVSDCMETAAEGPLRKIALQGGYLSVEPDTYRLWDDETVSYLCYNQQGVARCSNRLLTMNHMEEELAEVIKNELATCIDVGGFSTGLIYKTFDVIADKPMELDVTIIDDEVLLELGYLVVLKPKSEAESITAETFIVPIEVPLGDLYGVSQDILDAETSIGRFDTVTYMLAKTGKYTIQLKQPYPDKIYQLKLREGDYIFQFAVEGEPS